MKSRPAARVLSTLHFLRDVARILSAETGCATAKVNFDMKDMLLPKQKILMFFVTEGITRKRTMQMAKEAEKVLQVL
jgi:hypothetical protein